MLADLAAVAGDRYNYGIHTLTPVNLFIDEAAEVLNQPAIQLDVYKRQYLPRSRGEGACLDWYPT